MIDSPSVTCKDCGFHPSIFYSLGGEFHTAHRKHIMAAIDSDQCSCNLLLLAKALGSVIKVLDSNQTFPNIWCVPSFFVIGDLIEKLKTFLLLFHTCIIRAV